MSEPILVDETLLEDTWKAQLSHTARLCEESKAYFSDDGYDYLTAALEMAGVLSEMWYERQIDRFTAWLNTPACIDHEDHYRMWEEFESTHHVQPLEAFACDGITSALYDLNCPALPREEI